MINLVNVNKFSSYLTNDKRILNVKYLMEVSDEDFDRIASLSGKPNSIDTAEEITLLANCVGVVDIIPTQAAQELPANDPKLSGKKLGAMLFQNLQVLRFLGDTAAVGRYEAMLNHVMTKNGVTRTEVESFYRNGIRDLIAEVVTEEFNKISFMIHCGQGYNATLTRNTQNQYILSYEDINDVTKTLNANSLDALSSEMRACGDFTQSAIDEVINQKVGLIPANVYAEWKNKGITNANGLAVIIDTLTNFYLNPSQTTYNSLLEINARYMHLYLSTKDIFADIAQNSFYETIYALNVELKDKISRDLLPMNLAAFIRASQNTQFGIFSVQSDIGGNL